jgi:hypothetical protein
MIPVVEMVSALNGFYPDSLTLLFSQNWESYGGGKLPT